MQKSIAVLFLALAIPTLCSAASYSISDIGLIGGTVSVGVAISANGQVTGYFSTNGVNYDAFLYDGVAHDLGPFAGGNTVGSDINSTGQVVGYSQAVGVLTRAFLYDGTMHDLGSLLPGGGAIAYSINDSGQVTGTSPTPTAQNYEHAFLYDGTMHDLGTLGGRTSLGAAINNSGQVTGTSDTATGLPHAFLYDGTMHDLGSLGGASHGLAINSSGEVVGESYPSGGGFLHAFLYDGTMHDLAVIGAGTTNNSYATGINDRGQVVGYLAGASDQPFLYDSVHGVVNLNTLIVPGSGWSLISAADINNAGQIVGTGIFNGKDHAFILTPTPEPSSFVLAALGLLALAAWRLRRR
jgi:MYXO-CTERM domain-containing protein